MNYGPNEAVLNILRQSNTDLSKRRPIDFYLYFPTEEKALKADAKLTSISFDVNVSKSNWGKDPEWLCLAKINIIPNIKNLKIMTKVLERVAHKFGGNFDGWETMLSSKEAKGLPNI